MEKTFEIVGLGKGLYIENFWTGKKQVFINDVELKKDNKTTFSGVVGESHVILNLYGNFLTGLDLSCGGQTINLVPKSLWYEYTLAIIAAMLCIVWGNSIELCKIIPIVGGAIGGAISGLGFFMTMVCSKKTEKIFEKVLIGLAGIALTFLTCYIVALMILSTY